MAIIVAIHHGGSRIMMHLIFTGRAKSNPVTFERYCPPTRASSEEHRSLRGRTCEHSPPSRLDRAHCALSYREGSA
eukprot:scaffold56208_cov63-Phaeocystis_antarctica.AAC.1